VTTRSERLATEQDRHEAFEELVGGPTRAFRLLHMWQNTYDNRTAYDRLGSKVSQQEAKERKLRRRATSDGYTDAEIDAFLELHGYILF